jgi:hypothetical protein
VDSAGQRPRDSQTQDLEDRMTQSRRVKEREERKWVLQLAYYGGRQWTSVDGTGRLFEPDVGPYKLRLVDNRIMPGVLTQVAKMSKMRPAISVVPSTGDDLDFMAARIGETVLEEKWESLDLTRKRRQAILWTRVCAAGFWKICWDDRKGDPFEVLAVENDGQEQILLGAQGQPLRSDDPQGATVLQNLDQGVAATARSKTLFPGEVAVHVRSPFSIFPDPLAPEEGLEDTDWVIEETIQSPAWVRDRYNREVEADSGASAGIMESRMPGMEGEGSKVGVIVREFWARRCAEFPRGKHVVFTKNGTTLLEEDNPYGWLPYVMFRGTPYPGRFWPTCFAEQAISPQTELNNTLSQIAENAARIGNPPLARSRQANVEWDGLPGSELFFDDTLQNSLPQFIQPPEMPGYVQSRIPQLLDAISDTSGQHEVSSGAVPTGVTAAAAINMLQEADDTRIGPDVEDMEKTLADAGKRILHLVANYYTDERVVRIAGDNESWTIIPDFKGAMLRGNTDVQVQAGSTMPRSKAAMQAAMQDTLNLFLQYGVQVDQRSLRRFFRDMGVGGVERLTDEINTDEMQVQREHQRFQAGMAFAPNEWDNHQLHIEAHNEFRKGAHFERLDPAIQQNVSQHVLMHEQTVEQARQRDMQEQILMAQAQQQQTPTEGGAPSGP